MCLGKWEKGGRGKGGRMMGSRQCCLGILRGFVVAVVVVDLVECKMFPRGMLRIVLEI